MAGMFGDSYWGSAHFGLGYWGTGDGFDGEDDPNIPTVFLLYFEDESLSADAEDVPSEFLVSIEDR